MTFIEPIQPVAACVPDRFLALTLIYQCASSVPLRKPAGPGYYLSDIPINRGMLAVVSAMRNHGDSVQSQLSTTMRMMHMNEIFEASEYFGNYIRPGTDGDHSIEVADALLKAVAVARLQRSKGGFRFDLADVLAHAQRFEIAEDSRDGEER